jgi:pyruvate kinase
MHLLYPHQAPTKIVATIGAASSSREVIRQLIQAGMHVARLNFPHSSYEQHAQTITNLRERGGDLGVELKPEKARMLQKQIIENCNRKGLQSSRPTQMLESIIREPRPTRAEASDVANAIIDGTGAVMLSGESAIGTFPVRAVEIMARIAREVSSYYFQDLPGRLSRGKSNRA